MQAFIAACDQGSFSAAGRMLNLSATMVAKHVDAIEARLGTRLLLRTTRKLTLTEDGSAYRVRAAALLAEIADLERAFGADRDRPRGTLRLNAPLSYGVQRIAPIVAAFIDRFEGVRVDAQYVDRTVDVLDEGWDIAIRIAASLPDSSSLIARSLGIERLVLCAAPDYWKRQGMPTSP
jgi:DNA-binding transcriptional LysR family regulator